MGGGSGLLIFRRTVGDSQQENRDFVLQLHGAGFSSNLTELGSRLFPPTQHSHTVFVFSSVQSLSRVRLFATP